MAPIRRFEDIEGWQLSRVLQQEFSIAAQAPTFKSGNLKEQMRECPESAMSNIAEGFDADSNPEFARFLKIAYRSLTEFQSHLYTCKDERQLSHGQCNQLYEIARQAKSKVGGFIRYLKAYPKGPKAVEKKPLKHVRQSKRTAPKDTQSLARTSNRKRTSNPERTPNSEPRTPKPKA